MDYYKNIFDRYQPAAEQLNQRVEVSVSRSCEGPELKKRLREIIGLVDLTSLEGSDTKKHINDLCVKALEIQDSALKIPPVATVCVYPAFVGQVKRNLKGSAIKVACAAGGFPSGQIPIELKLNEIRYAVDEGADEIDMVISRGKLLEGNDREVFDEIVVIREVCRDVKLKVILETGELRSIDLIRKAGELAILAGADCIKTSTGKIQPAATPWAFLVMLDTIDEYYRKTGIKIGIKPAGGISTPEQALIYYQLVSDVLGPQWLNKELFRIGASRLINNILAEIEN
jgi:deoxyribose-phosphate aldolase